VSFIPECYIFDSKSAKFNLMVLWLRDAGIIFNYYLFRKTL